MNMTHRETHRSKITVVWQTKQVVRPSVGGGGGGDGGGGGGGGGGESETCEGDGARGLRDHRVGGVRYEWANQEQG
ncbi:hypothetical protein NHX12_004158, partial [Muraenolepis orangiensis]